MTAWTRSSRLSSLLGIDVPILTGAYGGMSSVELTALVSDLGGLGAYGVYGYSAERIRETADRLRESTARPFLLNVWVMDDADAVRPAQAVVPQAVRDLYAELDLPLPELPERLVPSFADQVDALVDAAPAAAGFIFGVPGEEAVRRLHDAGTVVVGTATTTAEAVALERGGVDAVIASGAEAGGHKPSFLQPADEALVGTMALVPRIVDAVSIPVIAACGTAFLATRQSAAPPAYRAALRSDRSASTVLTRASSGRLARGIPNRLTRMLGADPAPFPVQNVLTGVLRADAAKRDDAELLALWCGQGAPVTGAEDAEALFRALVDGTERALAEAAP
jgi:nitronate monooxygenase